MKEEDYWKGKLDGKLKGTRVTDSVTESKKTSTSNIGSFEEFMVKYQAGIIGRKNPDEKNKPNPEFEIQGMMGQSTRNLEDELAEETTFHNNLLTPESDYDPNGGLEQQEINLPESYGGFTDQKLSGYETRQDELEGPNVGYHGSSANGNGHYSI